MSNLCENIGIITQLNIPPENCLIGVFKTHYFKARRRDWAERGYFMDSILSKLAERGINAEIAETVKNGVTLTGYRILTGTNISPVVYRSEYEDEDAFVDRVVNLAGREVPNFDIEKLTDRDYVLRNIIVTMQKQSNEDVCKRSFLDLEGVIRIVLTEEDGYIGSVKITEQLQKSLGLSDEELFDHAIDNMRERFQVKSMTEVIGLPEELAGDCPLYVCLSNHSTAGASAIMMPEVFKAFCEAKGVEECTILPSSTEELIILAGKNEDASSLAAIVNEVNMTQVDPVIQLNPTVYVYNVKTGAVSIAATF